MRNRPPKHPRWPYWILWEFLAGAVGMAAAAYTVAVIPVTNVILAEALAITGAGAGMALGAWYGTRRELHSAWEYECACKCGRTMPAYRNWDGHHGPDFGKPVRTDWAP